MPLCSVVKSYPLPLMRPGASAHPENISLTGSLHASRLQLQSPAARSSLLASPQQRATGASRTGLECRVAAVRQEAAHGPAVAAGDRVEALELATGGEEAGIVELSAEDLGVAGFVDAVPAVGLGAAQVEIAAVLVLLNGLAGAVVLKGKAALAGWDILRSRKDGAHREGQETEEKSESLHDARCSEFV